jgi:hypothetical protein
MPAAMVRRTTQVSGRTTAVAIDPADPTGNTIYIGGAQGGVWKSTNAANITANSVSWSAITDDQATLSTEAFGRASTVARRGLRFLTTRSRIAETFMGAACNKVSTI